MSTGVPFVNRRDELGELRDGLRSDEGMFYAVVGPSGSGKSALLDRFQDQCEEDSICTVRHDIGEPKSETAFIYRILEAWDQALPDSKWDSIKERVRDANTEPFVQAAKFADPAVGAGARIINAALSGAVDSEELNNATDEVDFLINMLKNSPDERIAIIIDQFDERRLSESVSEDIGRFFREVSSRSPSNIVWCVGTDHEFGEFESEIAYVHVGPLDNDAIEELVDKTGSNVGEADIDSNYDEDKASFVTEITNFDGPNLTKEGLVDEIKTKTKGHPFMLALFLQTVRDEDISHAIRDLPISRQRARNHLEKRLLDRMEPKEEELMRDVCVLETFDANLAAHLSGNPVAETRQILSGLKERSIIREIDDTSNKHVYRLHDLIRDFLQDEIMEAREQQSRYTAIVVLSTRVHRQMNQRSSENEIVDPDVEELYQQIRFHFRNILSDTDVESAISSVYSTCEELEFQKRAHVESGLQYCYSVGRSESLPEAIEGVSAQF